MQTEASRWQPGCPSTLAPSTQGGQCKRRALTLWLCGHSASDQETLSATATQWSRRKALPASGRSPGNGGLAAFLSRSRTLDKGLGIVTSLPLQVLWARRLHSHEQASLHPRPLAGMFCHRRQDTSSLCKTTSSVAGHLHLWTDGHFGNHINSHAQMPKPLTVGHYC